MKKETFALETEAPVSSLTAPVRFISLAVTFKTASIFSFKLICSCVVSSYRFAEPFICVDLFQASMLYYFGDLVFPRMLKLLKFLIVILDT